MVFLDLFSVDDSFAVGMGSLAPDPNAEQVANLSTAPMALRPNDWLRSSAVQCGDMWGAVHTCHALRNEDFVDTLISFVGHDYKTMGRVAAGKANLSTRAA